MLPLALVDMMTPSKTIDQAKVGRKAWQAFNNNRKPRKSLNPEKSPRGLAWEGWKSLKNGWTMVALKLSCCCCCLLLVACCCCCCCSRCLPFRDFFFPARMFKSWSQRLGRLIARCLGKKTRIQSIMRIVQDTICQCQPPQTKEGPIEGQWWLTSWWFQPIWKICSSNWTSSPRRGEHKNNLKPPPSKLSTL